MVTEHVCIFSASNMRMSMGVGIQLRDTLSSLRMIQNKNIDI